MKLFLLSREPTEAIKGRYDDHPEFRHSSHSYEWKDLYSVLHTDKVFSILLKDCPDNHLTIKNIGFICLT